MNYGTVNWTVAKPSQYGQGWFKLGEFRTRFNPLSREIVSKHFRRAGLIKTIKGWKLYKTIAAPGCWTFTGPGGTFLIYTGNPYFLEY